MIIRTVKLCQKQMHMQNSSQEYKIHSGLSNRYPPLPHHACPPVCASVWISAIAELAGFQEACPHWVCDLARPPCPPAWCGTLTASEWSRWRTESPPSGHAALSGRGKRWNCHRRWLPVKREAWFYVRPPSVLASCQVWSMTLCQTTNHWARDLLLTNLLQNLGSDHKPVLNPFTAPARKISGLKDAWTCLQTLYFPVL